MFCLTPFSTVFQLYSGGQCTYPCFPGVLLTITIFFPSHWLLSHITIVETTDSSERGMNHVAWLSSILGKNIGRAGDRTNDLLKTATLLTELWGSAHLDAGNTTWQGDSIIFTEQKVFLSSIVTYYTIWHSSCVLTLSFLTCFTNKGRQYYPIIERFCRRQV